MDRNQESNAKRWAKYVRIIYYDVRHMAYNINDWRMRNHPILLLKMNYIDFLLHVFHSLYPSVEQKRSHLMVWLMKETRKKLFIYFYVNGSNVWLPKLLLDETKKNPTILHIMNTEQMRGEYGYDSNPSPSISE